MKQFLAIAILLLFIATAFIRPAAKSGVHGMIDPQDGASRIWAIRGTDSIATTPVSGKFAMEVNPGTWALIVEATIPYKNMVLDNVIVQENQSTDIGVIKLLK